MPILILIEEIIAIMGASIIAYQTSKETSDYPPGYEISATPILEPKKTHHHIYPLYQDPMIYMAIFKAIESVTNKALEDNEIIDMTGEDDIEPDTPEAIAELEKEIELIQTYHINTYKKKLERLRRGEPISPALTETQLLTLIDNCEKEIKEIQHDIEMAKYYNIRVLTNHEKELIKATIAEKMVRIKEDQLEKSQRCNCSISSFITKKMFRRNMSDLSADYQCAFTGESWARTENPKTGKMSVEIKEWLYEGPAGKADFDGWLEQFCLLLEMKANYDSLMFSRTQVNTQTGQPELKRLGKKKIEGFKKQAEKHDKICSTHPYAHCCWIFMTPLAYNAFLDILEIDSYLSLSAIWVPLS
ncbi:hypothetical protein A9G24_10600 [Gilliamella sp. App6-5]|uniref:Tox-REase-5 domain-containing protein n=1 Tax=Gilliamella sp. App6-5 TaxID=3120232 RepID=UPI00080E2779|nr:Tox-REase-5 domain-containing protein [Gilliamella apicola]OCG10164.1 hypothetical protein A9G24_10600 [Gilliamella apicola]